MSLSPLKPKPGRRSVGLLSRTVAFAADCALVPIVLLCGLMLKAVRRVGMQRLPICRDVLCKVGILPIRRHYYEPLPDPSAFRRPLDVERSLPGIDWNIEGQLQFMNSLHYAGELNDLCGPRSSLTDFRLENGSFESGDAEYLYQLIRARKPRRFFEIGSGHSTLIARRAIARNAEEPGGHPCKHLCIEPFEAPWLEQTGVQVIRSRVEDVDSGLFRELEENDVLFIDSSHVIRPQGDVLVEYLEILPSLRRGVIVHVHDVFSPRDYLKEWVVDRMWLWNEQYLLEAFLTGNRSWRILGALNLLHHHHFEELSRVCPYLVRDREPGSFYIERVE